jgi:hypothetical protein
LLELADTAVADCDALEIRRGTDANEAKNRLNLYAVPKDWVRAERKVPLSPGNEATSTCSSNDLGAFRVVAKLRQQYEEHTWMFKGALQAKDKLVVCASGGRGMQLV